MELNERIENYKNNVEHYQERLLEKIKSTFDDEEQFYKEIHRKKDDFWKNFKECSLYMNEIFKIQQILHLTTEETGSIFFGDK